MSYPGGAGVRSQRYVAELDGLRGIAILMVAISHYAEQTAGKGYDEVFFRAAQSGWIGVDLFFCLSGYLITGILLDTRDSAHYLRNFFLKRVLRIFPLYYAALGLYFYFFHTITEPGASPIHPLWLYSYGTNVATAIWGWPSRWVGHFWSLAVEEQFYAVWPFVVLALPRRSLLHACVLLWILAALLRWALAGWHHVDPTVLYVLTPLRIDPLMSGAILAAALREPSGARTVATWSRRLLPVAAAAVAVIGVQGAGYYYWEWSATEQATGYAALAITFACCLGLAVTRASAATSNSVLRAPVLLFFGKYSYAIYVFHVWFDTLARRHGLHPTETVGAPGLLLPAILLYSAAQLALASAAALVSWNLMEKHMLALKTRLGPGEPHADAAVASASSTRGL